MTPRLQHLMLLWLACVAAACAQVPTALAPASLSAALPPSSPEATAKAVQLAIATPRLVTLDAAALAVTRERLQRGDAALQGPLAALLRRADEALRTPPRSVTHKTTVPPSGSKHDYMSMGPYWWPNPDTSNGLPYVQRDGRRNPQATGNALDSIRMQQMLADARDLALAFHFKGELRYADKAAQVMRTWFLDPATRMNPSLRYGQAVPGVAEGRGIGIIDTRDLWMAFDALALIAPAASAGAAALSDSEQRALRQWFIDYAGWLDTSQLGRDEAAERNNHGMFYDMQLAALWLATGQPERARQLLFDARTRRFAVQFDAQGLMPLELARTRPFHYHTFTLEAATRMARHADVLDATAALPAGDPRCAPLATGPQCPLGLWRFEIDGKTLRKMLDRVADVVIDPASWSHATRLEPQPLLEPALPVLLMAQRAYAPHRYDAALAVLRRAAPDHVAWLLWPQP